MKKQIGELQVQKNSRWVELPFDIKIEYVKRGKILESLLTNKLTYTEFLRIKSSFEVLMRNDRYEFDKNPDKQVKTKSQVGEMWEMHNFEATLSFNDYLYFNMIYPDVLAKNKGYEKEIKNLETLLQNEQEKE